VSKPTVDQLREQVRAEVITTDDRGYDEARAVHNGMFDKHPLVAIRAQQVADVLAGRCRPWLLYAPCSNWPRSPVHYWEDSAGSPVVQRMDASASPCDLHIVDTLPPPPAACVSSSANMSRDGRRSGGNK